MPKLTDSVLTVLAHHARLHNYRGKHVTSPDSLATLSDRHQDLAKVRSWAHVYGMVSGQFRHVHSYELFDREFQHDPAIPDGPELVMSIEGQLQELLATYPPANGFEIVVVSHKVQPVNDVAILQDAAMIDSDALKLFNRSRQ